MKKKDYFNIFIGCLLVILVIIVVTGFSNFFGSDTDWVNQHTIFPEYLRNIFYKTGSILPNFSFNYGGGVNIFSISYYGLISPLILPSYLFPNLSMTTYTMIIDVLVLFASIFLTYKWLYNNNYNSNICLIGASLLGLSFPLIYHMHRHIMFVNYMPFLIMALIGVDKLIEKNKKSLLVFSIFLMMMTSYYFSVSGCVVVGIYFVYKYLKTHKKFEVKDFLKELLKIILLGILGVSLSAILILPTLHPLLSGRAEGDEIINVFKVLLPDFRIHNILNNTYGVGTSLIGFISSSYLFLTKKKENVFLGVVLMLITFFPIFRFILNAGFYLKEKCLIPFLPLAIISIVVLFENLFDGKIKSKKFNLYILLSGIILLIINNFNLSYLYIIFFFLVLICYQKYQNKKVVLFLVISVSFLSCIFANLTRDFVSFETYNNYFNKSYEEDINEIISKDNSYYRISNLMYHAKTVNKVYNEKQYKTGLYTSTYNNYYLNFIRNIFKTSNSDFNYFFVSDSPDLLFNSFMGVKYIYAPYDIGIKKISENTYLNEYALPLIYHSSNLIDEKAFDKISYPENTLMLLKNTVTKESKNTNLNNHFEKIDLNYRVDSLDETVVETIKDDSRIRISVLKDTSFKVKIDNNLENKILFINIVNVGKNNCGLGNSYIKINGVSNLITCKTWEYPNKNEELHYILSGNLNELNVELSEGYYEITKIDTFITDLSDLSDNSFVSFNIESIKNDTIKGHISVSNDGYLVTSIPFDKGFKIEVNNSEVEPEIVNKGFLGFKLDKGNYNIKINYQSPLLKEGKAISLVSLFIFLIIFVFDLKKKSS